jgi:tRNA uridine 5-carbamoylmethylation protein Kti12
MFGQDIFEHEWKSSRHLWDRKLFVVGDNLRLVTTKDDIEDKLDWVRQTVVRTNASLDEYDREEEARKQQIEEGMRERASEDERTSIDLIRDNLRKRFGTL